MMLSPTLLSFIAGMLIPCGFAPINLPGMTFIGIGLLYYLFSHSHGAKNAANFGLWFGIGKYGLGISWILVSLQNFSELPWSVAWLITLGLVILMSLYEMVFGYAFYRLKQANRPLLNCFSFAAFAVLMEELRSELFTGLPWLLVGHLTLDLPLSKVVPVIGSLGGSFIVYLLSSFFTTSLFIPLKKGVVHNYAFGLAFIISFLSIAWFAPSDWSKPEPSKTLTVSMVQGNIAHDMKWRPEDIENIFKTYQALSKTAHSAKVIIWPETALPIPAMYAWDMLELLNNDAVKHDSEFIIGMPGQNPDERYSNSAIMIGKQKGRYDKQHLVPFGEYMPMPMLYPLYRLINAPFADLSAGQYRDTVFNIDGFKLSPFICFEIAFNQTNYLKRIAESDAILTMTDDSWFGQSLALAQHRQIAQMRSLETGREQLFVSNNGLTSLIDHLGHIKKSLPYAKRGNLNTEIKAYSSNTPFLKWGNIPVLLFALLIVVIAIFRRQNLLS